MPHCKIQNCVTKRGEATFFSVPNSGDRRQIWIDAIESFQTFDFYVQNFPICEKHFDLDDILLRGKRKMLKPGAVPKYFISEINSLNQSELVIDQIISTNSGHGESTDDQSSNLFSGTSLSVELNNSIIHIDENTNNNWPFEQMIEISDTEQTDDIAINSDSRFSLVIERTEYRRLLLAECELIRSKEIIATLKKVIRQKGEAMKCMLKESKRTKPLMKRNSPNENEKYEEDANEKEILNCLIYGKSSKSYPESVRRFGLTASYYSPSAYSYMRSVFKFRLPSIRTIRSWYSSVNGSPGFTTEALEALRLMANEMKVKNEQLITCLISDEMYIRPRNEWDPKNKQYTGFISIGIPMEHEDALPLAKNVLVFMISGMNKNFKVPVAYFLTNGLRTEERAALTQEVIMRVCQTGTVIACTTFDGLIANLSTARYLGADFKNNKPYFPNPTNEEKKIFVILDPPHMLKLARNCFASKKILVGGKLIRWELIESLEKVQREEGLNLGNKIKAAHLNWTADKMCVRLAAETMSESVADSIDQLCQDGRSEFNDSNTTTQFIRIINNLFDMMNSKKNHEGKAFKKLFSSSTEEDFLNYFAYAQKYLKTLEIEQKDRVMPILKSRSFTPFFGFFHNMTSLQGLYDEYVKNGTMDELYAFTFSQDHLESFFGCSRRMNGCNDNPTPQQFRAAYRKLLICNEVTCSEFSNCMNDATQILTVSSRQPSRLNVNEDNEIADGIAEILLSDENRNHTQCHSIAYVASLIEEDMARCIQRKGRGFCRECISVFVENEIVDDSLIRLKAKTNEISQPCKSTVQILHAIDDILQQLGNQTVDYASTVNTILNHLNHEDLYCSSDFEKHTGTSHKRELIESIVKKYLNIRSKSIADSITSFNQSKPLRRILIKHLHSAGQ